MMKINLLPEDSRKFNFSAYIKDFFAYIVVAFCFVVAGNVLLMSVGTKKIFEVQSVQRKWTKKEPEAKNIEELKKEVAQLRNKSQAFTQNVFPVVSFSEIMYVIHENLPMNLWLRSMEFRGNDMVLSGSALDFEGDASLSVKEYIEALKSTSVANYFNGEIKIASLERSRIGDKSVLRFGIRFNKKASDEK